MVSDEQFPDLRNQLEAGWKWLWDNCEEGVKEHPGCAAFESRWWEKLREYERACVAQSLPPPRGDRVEGAATTQKPLPFGK
jgi:hypothetical protein